jgi:hypothetical protein
VAGHVMIIRGVGDEWARTHVCRKDVQVEVAGKATRQHALYNWGTFVTLITHAAAEEVGLEQVRQPTAAVAGLFGGCTVVGFHYMVHIVDGDNRVRVVKAMRVDSITALGATSVPPNIEKRFPQAKGWGISWRGWQRKWSC